MQSRGNEETVTNYSTTISIHSSSSSNSSARQRHPRCSVQQDLTRYVQSQDTITIFFWTATLHYNLLPSLATPPTPSFLYPVLLHKITKTFLFFLLPSLLCNAVHFANLLIFLFFFGQAMGNSGLIISQGD